MEGNNGPEPPIQHKELVDSKKFKQMRLVALTAIALIVVMAALLAYDNYKLQKSQEAYEFGWNECASECNAKLDILKMNCPGLGSIEGETEGQEIMPLPAEINLTAVEDGNIQIVN